MTITVEGDEVILEQVTKQLNKLVNVIRVSEMDPNESVDRELAIIKVAAKKEDRSEIMQIVSVFRAKIIDVSPRSLIIEVTGTNDKIEAMVRLLRQFGIKEMARTGRVSMVRGTKAVVP
jgi:acetolactate synthase-1/3 small subunit